MKYRRLGKSGVKVSEIGFGAWTIGLDWWGKKIDDDEAIKMLKKAYDLGINFYETADMYGKGKSERLMGQAFKGMRDEVVYSTKWGYDMYGAKEQVGHAELPQKHDPEFLKFALKQSMERLQTDHIDVYSMHNPKMDAIQNDELFADLDALVKNGTIKGHGVALGPAIGWREEGLFSITNRNITCLQTVYNILEQDPGRDLMKAAEQHDVGIMVRVPDASGLLTGKVTADTKFDRNDHRSFRKQEFIREAMQKIENMKPLASGKGWNITQLAIKFILSQPAISVVLPTMVSVEEIELFASMSDGSYLNASESAQLEEMYEKNFYVKPVASS
ncbi:aldo/keto reductase [Nitrososphaera sp.]|uniref:aldo/keto reductase n=1 Tax=Nitrososphaera sp. TaxID=1971748 RepID=UPI00307D9CD7